MGIFTARIGRAPSLFLPLPRDPAESAVYLAQDWRSKSVPNVTHAFYVVWIQQNEMREFGNHVICGGVWLPLFRNLASAPATRTV